MRYDVVEKATPYKISENLYSEKTIVINFFNDEGEVLEIREFGAFTIEQLLHIKSAYTDFKFRELYFFDFSIDEYKEFFGCDSQDNIRDFYAERCFFDGNSDFSNTRFGGDGFSLANSIFGNGKVNFEKSYFWVSNTDFNGIKFGNGEKNFSFSHFYGKEINFYGAHFGNGNVSFRANSLPEGHLNFSGASFGDGHIDFDYSIFSPSGLDFSGTNFGKGDVSFRNANFSNGDIIFFASSFELGKVSFSGSIFGNSNIDFSFCRYSKCDIHFRYVVFGSGKFNMTNLNLIEGKIVFKAAEFKGKPISFSDSTIDELIFKDSIFIEHVNMRLKYCRSLVLENCIIEKTFDLASSSKKVVNIEAFNVLNTKNLGQIYIDWKMNKVKEMVYSQGDKTNFQEKANQFRLLKENFRNIGRYNDEDLAYLEFKRCESIYKLRGENLPPDSNKKIHKIRRYMIYPFKWFVLDFVGNYATNPFRIGFTMLITVITFAGIYTLPFVKLDGDKFSYYKEISPILQKALQGLYHSIATILTIGYGDVNPGNIYAMLLSGIEGFMGMFLMSYFTVDFVRKILR
ncbi:ion channel [Clostridium manihotivorum]|uniref:Potassium channel domain-containing protein n=1 Tax=Clostridium manihotivorum TaxID=2320868 RepID=A0A3R5QXX2_9CLOT|nr:potassium channel family protein [Clostridium manihotivorum]QAA34868.1 hypothetical protein C1I91_26320 [Clostridium manihotivorum]